MTDLKRRSILKTLGMIPTGAALGVFSFLQPLLAKAAQILSVRVWPANDYTRVTIENDASLKAQFFTVDEPLRLVVDIQGLELNSALKELVAKIQPNDPYIKKVRVGQNRPQVVRIVFDLKAPIKPQVFSLEPVANYQHRLIFDLYPSQENDPLAEFLQQQFKSESSAEKLEPKNEGHNLAVDRIITIVLDPGHGGEDPGAIGPSGAREKDVVLEIAKKLQQRLGQNPNVRVILTRDADFFVPLGMRVQKARRAKADLFVSIHADAFIEPRARGSSVFVLSEGAASSTAARWLAKKENAADLIGGVNIKQHDRQIASVLLDLSTTAQIQHSVKLARAMIEQIGDINQLHKNAVEQASFAVLKAPDIPSILIETAFISNPEEEQKLIDPQYQEQMAEAIFKGIVQYFRKNPSAAKGPLT